MLISIRWYVSNKQGKEIARTHTPLSNDTCVWHVRKIILSPSSSSSSFSPLFITTINDDRCICVLTSLMCPLAEEKIARCYFNNKKIALCACMCSLKRIGGRQHLDSFLCIFDCAWMNMGYSMWKISSVWSTIKRTREREKRQFPSSKWFGSV